MSASIASARMAGSGQALPQEAVHNRSLAMMNKLSTLEKRYVNDWTTRIDLQVKAADALGQHIAQAKSQGDKTRERFRTRNEIWAARSEAAAQWRKFQAQQKFNRCSSAVELHDRRMNDFDAWKHRVLVEAPRQELERRNEWLGTAQGSSLGEVDRHHKKLSLRNSELRVSLQN
mmetsp:Transcript_52137/g.93472  ORF Transcript_52137/g.93472 Transcript_52137/m.93472 type:complete len:174 (-) Transcript_52137:193-714(-)